MKPGLLTLSRSVLALTILSGCSWLGDVSSNMRVDTGLEPQNIDSNVRFRTTYYFRVLTGCSIKPTPPGEREEETPFVKRMKGDFVPLKDSLYRFRMTGQAAALFKRVHFESGVLRKEQIDPFGSSVGAATTTPPDKPDTEACVGKPSENRYYLLGPEGAKELDPNDRLLLALSVDSKPLISALQQLSDRKFQSAGTNYQIMETLLQERGQILDSRSMLQKAERGIGQETGPGDQSKLKSVLDALRKPYVTTIVNTPAQ